MKNKVNLQNLFISA